MKTPRSSRRFAGSLAALALVTTAVGCSGASSDDSADAPGQGASAQGAERPPQFVLLAFDGSLNLNFWQESRAFARDSGAKYTYFMSGTYFLPDSKKSAYHGPHHNAGASDIGFGGPAENIALRLQQVKNAHAEGHEMASHANGHFDGSAWTEADWDSEFAQFNPLIFKAAETAGVASVNLGFGPQDVKGFRAPLLGHSPGLFRTLAKSDFTYDTSKSGPANYWPEKLGGIWNFPLAQVRIVGSGKRTLSMDYNFYYAQSAGESRPENKETYKKEMLDTYMKYFQDNYFGNRAPVHIGHHFSKWNGGAYWEAMQTFTKRVCGLPEVKCVTYGELVKFMEQHAGDRARYQAGDFTPLPRPPGAAPSSSVEPAVPADQFEAEGLVGDVAAAHDEEP
jgi:hypothetical protein